MRAMVLAAGLGTRLRPLTDLLPKPLAPLLNRPLIDWVLDDLESAGVTRCVINAHHLPELLSEQLAQRRGMQIEISRESQILGTGGGLLKARAALGSEPFIVQNSDCLLRPDYNRLYKFHCQSRALATLLIMRHPQQRSYGEVRTDVAGRVIDIAGLIGSSVESAQSGMFVGVHVLSPQIFDHAPAGKTVFGVVRDLYVPLIKRGALIQAMLYEGEFVDVGTIEGFVVANLWALEQIDRLYTRALEDHRSPQPGVYLHRSARIDPAAELRPPLLIGAQCTVEGNTRIGPRVVIGQGSAVEPGARIEHAVMLPQSRVPGGRLINSQLIMPAKEG
ncbi:MAG: NDP-sugar synthase [Candidatus Alcyoniella australis]|nr:NDP-sugar synthase [Candidatus Alcyoniella australis]